MNKYLLSFSVIFSVLNAYATELFPVYDDFSVVADYESIDFNDIKTTTNQYFKIKNSHVMIDDFSSWQEWDVEQVKIENTVWLHVADIHTINSGDKINHITLIDDSVIRVVSKDADNLYRVDLSKVSGDIYLNVVRETDYRQVFNNKRGIFLENIRAAHSDDKMLLAMDRARNMGEIKSIMNSAYHFNPIILMNPVKTINRSRLLDLSMDKSGAGANVDYMVSNKLNDFGSRLYFGNKYNDFYFNIGLNFDAFSYHDSFNEFDGMLYGIDIHAKQYIDKIWFDGLLGFNGARFNAENIYVNNNVSNNPNGTSEYLRFVLGYDYSKIKDFIVSPFVGVMAQKSHIMDFADTDTNLITGINGKYDFIMDGIKYEYGASVSTDEKANCNVGLNIGFLSLLDNAGASFGINAFHDEFDVNYKLSLKAKIQF